MKIKNQFSGPEFPENPKIERHHADRFAFNLSFLMSIPSQAVLDQYAEGLGITLK